MPNTQLCKAFQDANPGQWSRYKNSWRVAFGDETAMQAEKNLEAMLDACHGETSPTYGMTAFGRLLYKYDL